MSYTFRSTWSPEDSEYVGICEEFPSLTHLAPHKEEALIGIHVLVHEALAGMTPQERMAHVCEVANSRGISTQKDFVVLARSLGVEAQTAGKWVDTLLGDYRSEVFFNGKVWECPEA